ncbi:hypothetical protein BT96DRAFT_1018623 [Gymnopus androsaceus JB14]|uniref:Major facilitator superfamily (MFS) profile domain-containing protein n=1 Tax=Gymnopus androsaceus JB14 TaxID=1447944 RepID=A0A6A4HU28_9AGAR|nr:hypothetical protein BT96DRAFT_1018623 [Gymnopus androsaceus JB14]
MALPALLQAFGPFVLIFTALLGPESPRFLLSKSQGEKALDILAKFHANGDHDDELVQREFQQISEHIQRERMNKSGSWSSLIRYSCKSAAVADPGPISTYLPIMLRSNTRSSSAAAVNGSLAVFNIFAGIMGGLCVDKVGRRPLFLISTTGMLITYTVIIIVAHGPRWPNYILWKYCRSQFGPRVYPLGLWLFAASNALGAFLNPIGLKVLQWRFYFVFLAIQTMYLFLIWWFFIETRGRTIEQVSVLLDEHREVASPGLGTESEEKVPYLS